MNLLLPTPEHFRVLGYWIVFVLSFWESTVFIGLAIPGILLFPAAGFLVAVGAFDPIDVFWFSFAGALAGNYLSYSLGTGDHRLITRFKPFSTQVERGKTLLARKGLRAMIPGWFQTTGNVIPFLAGSSRLPRRSFIGYAAISSALGVGTYLSGGYLAGQAWRGLGVWSTKASFFVATIFVFLAFFVFLRTLIVKGAWPLLIVLSSILRSLARFARTIPFLKPFLERHPGGVRFMERRFDADKFEGLPLTLLALVLGFSLFLLGGLVEDFLASDPIISVDRRLASLLLTFRTPGLLAVFVKITLLGNWQIILGGAFLFSLYLLLERKKDFLLPFLVSLGGCSLFTTAGKWVFHRQRPFDMTKLMEFSFPSGHSTYAACFYGFLAYFLLRQTQNRARQVDLIFFWGLTVAAVAFSRLYIGVHYLSDVLAGALLGLAWLLAGISLAELKKSRKAAAGYAIPGTSPAGKENRYWGTPILVAGAALYIFTALTYTPPYFIPQTDQPSFVGTEAKPFAPFDSGTLPQHTESIAGTAQEPLSLMIFVKDEESLVENLKKAGWKKADAVSFRSLLKSFKAVLMNQSYQTAPVTPSFWNGAPLDIAFEKETAIRSLRQRHHVRLWKTGVSLPDGRVQYVGAASFDEGVNWLHFTHRIDPAIDRERQIFVKDCLDAGIVSAYRELPFTDPASGSNFSGDAFFSDGKIALLELSPFEGS
ncbi:MAG: LssY C-terminal domain-containing protein [Synergistaceae bacterium]|nr:LssY C-terminal domain-containing protein [Synergistaceae bacterium]